MTALNSAYSFVQGAESLAKIENRREIIDKLVAETTQCAYFLRDYLSSPSSHGQFRPATRGPILVVIDGLDAIASGDATTRANLLELLSTQLANLPRNLRFMVTSRIEPDVYHCLANKPHITCKPMYESDALLTKSRIGSYIGGSLDFAAALHNQPVLREWRRLEPLLTPLSNDDYVWARARHFCSHAWLRLLPT
jgi:hypothetical protein